MKRVPLPTLGPQRSFRRRRRPLRAVLLLALVAAVVLVASVGLSPFPAVKAPPAGASGPIPGFFHVHADASHDGHGSLEEAVAAAKDLGGRFVVLTEHNVVRPEAPTYVDGVLVIPGVEISSDLGHVIALGASKVPEDRGPKILDAIAAEGGDAWLAHPVNRRRPWGSASPDGFAGFEALSLDSAFREAKETLSPRILLALAAVAGDMRKVGALILERPGDALRRYDDIANTRDLTLVCGVDAHGLPPYEGSFGALALHAELDPASRAGWGRDAAADAAAVLASLRAGRSFCSVPALGDAGSFSLSVGGAEVVARVELPSATLVLFRDGAEVARGRGPELRFPAAPGSWRAEVLLDPGFPWSDGSLWIASSARRRR